MQGKDIESDGKGAVWIGEPSNQVVCGQRPEGSDGESQVYMWGMAFQTETASSSKTLRKEHALTEWKEVRWEKEAGCITQAF